MINLKKVYSVIIPFKGYIALTLYPWVFIRTELKKKYTPTVNRHETTHGLQQIETVWIFFLLIYLIEYIIKFFICGFNHNRAYRSISFEQEAYHNQGNVSYNETRKHYSWIKYIVKLYNEE